MKKTVCLPTRFLPLTGQRKKRIMDVKAVIAYQDKETIMYTIGVDLGGTNIAAGVVNDKMEIVVKGSVPTLPDRGGDAIMADMAALCLRLAKEAGVSWDEIESVGIASPGTILYEEGVVERSDNLHFYRFPIRDKLAALLPKTTVYLENDANAAAWAEAMCGAARGTRD